MALHPKLEATGISMTEAEYLAAELTAEVRHKYIDGRAYAMTGGSTNHDNEDVNEFRSLQTS